MLRRLYKLSRAALTLTAAIGVAACGDAPPPTSLPALPGLPAYQGGSSPDPVATLTQPEQKRQALRRIAACLRRTEARVDRMWERMVADIDVQTGRPKRRDIEPFVYTLDAALAPCEHARVEPDLVGSDIEAVFETYVEATRKLARPAAELADYYDSGGHEQDAWARAAELATSVEQARAGWQAAAEALAGPLARARDEADEALLELWDHDPPGLVWHLVAVSRDARVLARCLKAEQPDPALCRATLEAFRTSRAALDALVVEDKERYAFVFWLDAFSRNATLFEQVASQAVEAIAAGKKRGKIVYGPRLRKQVRETFAHLEDTADNVRFDV